MRQGLLWLRKHTRDKCGAPVPVDYDEILRQMEICEKKHRENAGDCGCDWCPNLKRCRRIFDSRCPETTLDEEIVFMDRPWCCGTAMNKIGFRKSGDSYRRVYRCRKCKRTTIRLDNTEKV